MESKPTTPRRTSGAGVGEGGSQRHPGILPRGRLGTTTLLVSTTNLEKRSLALGEWKPRYETCNQPRLHPQVWLCVRGPLRDVLARILLGPYPRLLLQVCTLEVVEWPHHLVSG